MSCEVCAGYSTYNCPVCGGDAGVIICPDCNGTGEGDWKVFDIRQRIVVRCSEIAYLYAPDTEDQAEQMGRRYCKESNVCQTCQGAGEIPE